MKKEQGINTRHKSSVSVKNTSSGITLIALVITIIVLLILAGVSISLVVGENGVLNQATQAVKANKQAEEEEKVKFAAAAAMDITDLKVKQTALEKELDNHFGNGNYELVEETGYYEITITESGRKYKVDSYGSTTRINDEEETLAETDAKYFDFTYDETTKTAILTGIKEEYFPSITVDTKDYGIMTENLPAYIQDGENKITEISIPASITVDGEKYIVNAIGASVFSHESLIDYGFAYGRSEITKIIIPDGITSIGDSVFMGCTKLTKITIPQGVTSIGNNAFKECIKLTEATIPDSVTTIGDGAFSGCRSLTEITIPDGITSIGDDLFNDSALTKITIPDSVTSIGDSAFSGTVITEITIPDGVTSIGDGAFSSTSLKEIIIPEGVTSIGNYLFNDSALTKITIPDSVTSIGNWAFYLCRSLKEITIPNSVTSIGEYAFHDSGLIEITIPDGVTSIGKDAFFDCENLTKVIISDSVTSIGKSVFGYSSNLKDIYCEVESQPSTWDSEWLGSNTTPTVHWGSTGE